MKRATSVACAAAMAVTLAPSTAYAADGSGVTPTHAAPRRESAGLLVAIVLLVEALNVRKVAFGGALAEKISFVVLAIVCLAASAVAQWVQNFVVDVTQQQVQLASQTLVIAAMGLLAAYFYSVRAALQSYLQATTGSEMLAAAPEAQQMPTRVRGPSAWPTCLHSASKRRCGPSSVPFWRPCLSKSRASASASPPTRSNARSPRGL